MTLKVGRGAEAPPFMVMDVIAAANAREAGRAPGDQREQRFRDALVAQRVIGRAGSLHHSLHEPG